MKYLSVKEYFYKLNTIGFIVLLIPLLTFCFLYFRSLSYLPPFAHDMGLETDLIGAAVIALDLTIVHLWWIWKMNRLRSRLEIAQKMDGYYELTVMKMVGYCIASLLTGLGFFLTGSPTFSYYFIGLQLLLAIQWPTRSSLCSKFSLRSDERAMIMENVDFY